MQATAHIQPEWVTIVISWIGSGFLSAFVAGIYNLWAARSQYENDYYKTVINKRIAAYEKMELLIAWLKPSTIDSDGKRCHVLFHGETEEQRFRPFGLVTDVLSQGIWVSEEAFSKLREFSDLIYHLGDQTLLEFGKKHYESITKIRVELERILAKDMLRLHDVKAFLKAKDKPSPGSLDFKES